MNCKEEFIKHIGDRKVKCALIKGNPDYEISKFSSRLDVGYSEKSYAEFLESLDFEYDEDFGHQELIGIIWYVDDTWSERAEYDGSEWWVYKRIPSIPDILL